MFRVCGINKKGGGRDRKGSTMKNKKSFVLGMLAAVLALGVVFTACGGGKKNSGGGGSSSDGGSAAASAAKAVKGTGKVWTLSKDKDFVYDLIKIDGADYVSINGINRPEGFKEMDRSVRENILIDTLTVKVPEKIEGYTVGAIGEYAFAGIYITAVTLPDTVVEIGFGALSSSISAIKLPKNLKKLGDQVFRGCKNLSAIAIPEGVTEIPMMAFDGAGITEVIIPDSVTTIGDNAFANCKELTTVKLPAHPIGYWFWQHDDRTNAGKLVPTRGGGSYSDKEGANDAFLNCPKLSLAARKAIEESGYTGRFAY